MAEKKKIALIANGVGESGPDSLETLLCARGCDVDVFDVRKIERTDHGFLLSDPEPHLIDPTGYDAVVRSIKGGVSGDTAKSLGLQKQFELHGAVPHIKAEASLRITDRISCRNVLEKIKVPCVPGFELPDEDKDFISLAEQLQALGAPPYSVRKNIGSGAKSLVIAHSVDEVKDAVHGFMHPADGTVGSNVLVHGLTPTIDRVTLEKYGLQDLTRPESRHYHFRSIMVDGELFGTSIAYSEPGTFGLNPAQGVAYRPIDRGIIPPEVALIARKAADAHGLRIAAIDVAWDGQAARVLDMNASPNLSFTNERGEKLSDALADSVQSMVQQGKYAERFDGVAPIRRS